MKTAQIIPIVSLTLALVLAPALRAETSVKLNGVHLCCKSCVTGAEKVAAKVEGSKITADKDAGTVAITAPSPEAAQKAVNALLAAGFYGTPSDATVKVRDASKMRDHKVQSLEIKGVHLCCKKCSDAVNKAVSGVSGVKECNAEKDAKSFTVTGDFNAKDVFVALNKAGFNGRGPSDGKGKGKKKQ